MAASGNPSPRFSLVGRVFCLCLRLTHEPSRNKQGLRVPNANLLLHPSLHPSHLPMTEFHSLSKIRISQRLTSRNQRHKATLQVRCVNP
jgi:hypothetical protein